MWRHILISKSFSETAQNQFWAPINFDNHICEHFLSVFWLLLNVWSTTLGVQRSFWVSREALSSSKISLRIPGDHILIIVGRYNWYKLPQSAKKFEKVKKSRFLGHFLNPDYPQKSACMAFISANMSSRALYWTWNRSQTTLLNVETHFDTQIVVRDPIEVILVRKTSENLSNRDFFGKSTEMMAR